MLPRDIAALNSLWTSRDATISALLHCAILMFGEDFLGTEDGEAWEPETLREELKAAGINPSEDCFARLLAGMTLVTTNQAEQYAMVFNHVANLASGRDCDVDQMEPAEPEECEWLLTEMMLIEPPTGDTEDERIATLAKRLSPEVRTFLRVVMDHDGMYGTPGIIGRIAVAGSDSPDAFLDLQLGKSKEMHELITSRMADLAEQAKLVQAAF